MGHLHLYDIIFATPTVVSFTVGLVNLRPPLNLVHTGKLADLLYEGERH